MALRAKKPVVEKENRLKVLLYANTGAGKTHFCCSLPSVYYIDTEGVEDYKHFRKMLDSNKSEVVRLNDINDIIKEVTTLLSVKHDYKTLVIDSLSFPYAWLAQSEAERLAAKSPHTEGTEFGANLAKAKRLTFQLGIMLSRLDMNVIVIAHERTKFEKDKEVGKSFDINDKMAYSLGAVWNLRLQGKFRKLFVEKSRYEEMKTGSLLDFEDGYEVIKQCFGEDMFLRETKTEELATPEQLKEFKRLVDLLRVTDEQVAKWLGNANAIYIEDMNTAFIEKCINVMNKKYNGVEGEKP